MRFRKEKKKPAINKFMENDKEFMYINSGLITATIFTILPLVGLFAIPNTWWGLIIKGFLFIIELANLKTYLSNPIWTKARGFAAGLIFNMVVFTIIWFTWPHWISYVCCIFFIYFLKIMKDALEVPYTNKKENLPKMNRKTFDEIIR